jgi:hypothetical protein
MDIWTARVSTQLSTLEASMDTVREQVAALSTLRRKREHPAGADQETEEGNVDSHHVDTKRKESGEIAGRILAATQRLGTSAPDRQIAREARCSPTTVARWKKKARPEAARQRIQE